MDSAAPPTDDTATTPPPAPPHAMVSPPEDPRMRGVFTRGIGELGLAVAAAAVVSLILQVAVRHMGLPKLGPGEEYSYVPNALVTLSALVGVAGILWYALRGRDRHAAGVVACYVVLAAVPTLVLALPLHGTDYYLNGLGGDNGFRARLLEKMTAGTSPVDNTYQGIPALYPVGWFWLAGRFANLAHIPAWQAYKPCAIATAAIAPVLAFWLWSRLTSRPKAACLALTTVVAGFAGSLPHVWEPYSWIVVVCIPPMGVVLVRLLADPTNWPGASAEAPGVLGGRVPGWVPAAVGGGLFVGVSSLSYTLLTMYLVVLVGTLAVGAYLLARTDGSRALARTVKVLLPRLAVMGAVTAAIALPQWFSYLHRALTVPAGPPPNAAQHYLPQVSSYFAAPMLDATPLGVLALAGTVWCVYACRRDVLARGVLGVVAAAYLWQILSFLANAADTSLLAFRMWPIIEVTLYCSGVLAFADALRWLRPRVDVSKGRLAAAAVVLAGGLTAVSVLQVAPNNEQDAINAAYSEYYPNGTNARGEADVSNPSHYSGAVIRAVDRGTGVPQRDTILLTDEYRLLAFAPYWSFLAQSPQYSNPLGEMDKRRDEVIAWAHAASPQDLVARLDVSRFTAPNAFVLRTGKDGLHLTVTRDNFPKIPENIQWDVVFPESLFASKDFTRTDVGPFAVITRNRA